MKLNADALLPKAVPGINQAVGQTAFKVQDLSVDDQDRQIEIFDQPLTLGANLSASAEILAAQAPLDDPFGSGSTLQSPAGKSFAALDVAAGLQLSGQASPSIKGATLNLKATAGSDFSYRHLLPVAQSGTRQAALLALVEGVRVPSLVSLDSLAPGEIHTAKAKVELDFNADFSAGVSTQKTLTQALFDGLSAQAQVQGSATLSAGFGMSLYDDLVFTVGRGGDADSWPRLRLEKLHKRHLSLTSTLQLQVSYDFGSSLITILENALDQLPIPTLLTTLQEVNGLLASGNWDAVKSKISAKGAQTLDELLDDTGWKEWLEDSPEVAEFVEFSNKVVSTYNGLDERVQSLWGRLLGKADLGPSSRLRQALEQLAAVNPESVSVLEELTKNSEVNEVLALVQHLTGETLDDILLDSIPGAQKTLGKAVDLAQQAVKFLTETPQDVMQKIEAFANKAGIAQTVRFLAANATSTTSIEGYVSSRIQKLVADLVGKAWDHINASDLEKVQAWAQKLQPILEAPNALRDELEKRIKTTLEKLIGQASFSATMSIDYAVSRSALLDVEISPQAKGLRRKVEKAMATGSIQEILDRLVEADQQLAARDDDSASDDEPAALPFRLNQCVFTSRRVRSRSFGLSFHGFGASFSRKGIVQRVEDARLEALAERNSRGQIVRRGTYSAGFTRRDVLDAGSNETAIWLESRAEGVGLDFSKKYQGKPQPSMRLVFTREDTKATAQELSAMSQLLEGFGFELDGIIERKVSPNWTTQLSLSFNIVDTDGKALEALVGGTGNASTWNGDFLDASHAWFHHSIDDRFLNAPTDISWGRYFDALTHTEVFRQNWTSGVYPFLQAASSRWGRIPVANQNGVIKQVPVKWTERQNVSQPNQQLGLLYGSLIPKRAKGVAAKQRTLKAWEALEGTHDDAHYRALSRRFVNGCLRSAVYGPTWPSSLFILWLTLVRIERRQRDLLSSARGLLLLRFRADSNEEWQEPIRLTLPHGILPQST